MQAPAFPSEVKDLAQITVSQELVSDVENLALGVFAPLRGFIGRNDFLHVLSEMRLADEKPWPLPIVLDTDREGLSGRRDGDDILLVAPNKLPIAILTIEEVYPYDKQELAKKVFGTDDSSHPGVAKTMRMQPLLVGGKTRLLNRSDNKFGKYALTPSEAKLLFQDRGWRTIVGFQTRNVPHLGHEYLQKTALSFVDGIFINPVIGRKKKGDFKDEVIIEAYEALINNYYVKEQVVLAVLRTEMRYAGPREALFHAIVRRNFGCTHFLVGRDHAGVGNYYPPYAAQEIFQNFPDIGIAPLFFTSFFYCKRCGGVANEKICPHDSSNRVDFSGTRMREAVRKGQAPPPEMIRREVADVILKYQDPFVGDSY